MSTTAAAQPILTIVKDEFTKVLTKGTLSPSTKPTNWNVVITEKSLLEAMKALSPPPEETQNRLTVTISFLLCLYTLHLLFFS
jgi:hypothetical protein